MSYGDFITFAHEKGLYRDCPICGANDWHPQVNTGEKQVHGDEAPMFLSTIPDARIEKYFAVYLMNCRNCGNVRFVSAKVLMRWRDARG